MSLVDIFWSAPPVTRTWAGLIFVESILNHAGILSPYHLAWDYSYLFKLPPQVWRLVTSFTLTSGLNIVFLPYMVWNYGGWLERECMRFASRPGSFFVYVVFVGLITLLLGNSFWGIPFFTNPLVTAMIYTWSQENRGRPTQVYFITVDAKYLWLVMLFVTFLMSGFQAALVECTGVVAAHLYDFLTIYWPRHGGGTDLIVTPRFISTWFDGGARTTSVPGGTAFRPRAEPSTGASSGFSSWNSRGQGRRLGGE